LESFSITAAAGTCSARESFDSAGQRMETWWTQTSMTPTAPFKGIQLIRL